MNLRLLISICLLLSTSLIVKSQNIFSEIFYSFENVQSSAVVSTFDNSYLIVGRADAGFILKIDSAGNKLWDKEIGVNTIFNSVTSTEDSCFTIAGTCINTASSKWDLFVIKINSNGDTLWTREIGYTYSVSDFFSIQQTFDGGYILTGTSSSSSITHVIIVKLDTNGNHQWSQIVEGGNHQNNGYSVHQTPDSSFVINGFMEDSPSPGTYYLNSFLLKLNSSGTILWLKKYNSPVYDHGWSTDLKILSDGILCLVVQADLKLMKTDFSGNVLWARNYGPGGFGCSNCGTAKLVSTSDNGFIIFNLPGILRPGLIKIDTSGNVLWARDLILDGSDLIETSDHGFLLTGVGADPGGFSFATGIIKTDSLGNGTSCVAENTGTIMIPDSMIGTNSSFSNYPDGSQNGISPLISTPGFISDTGCVHQFGDIENILSDNKINIYPNPSQSEINISSGKETGPVTIEIINIMGEIVFKNYFSSLDMNSQAIKLQFPSGIYKLYIRNKDSIISKKIVIQRD